MNREIKFRGRDESGKWHYGSLLYKEEESPVQETNAPYIETYIEGAGLNDPEIEVPPYTVGQFTGLKDANGKEIYEGDIVTIGLCTALVTWNEELATFALQFDFEDKVGRRSLGEWEDTIVISNIHDNPELLKGGK